MTAKQNKHRKFAQHGVVTLMTLRQSLTGIGKSFITTMTFTNIKAYETTDGREALVLCYVMKLRVMIKFV